MLVFVLFLPKLFVYWRKTVFKISPPMVFSTEAVAVWNRAVSDEVRGVDYVGSLIGHNKDF